MGSIRIRGALALVVSLTTAAVGCSLSSDYTSDPNNAPLNEGAVPKVDASAVSDGGGGGGKNADDSGVKQFDTDAGNVAKSVFCMADAGGALLACDDFDKSTTLASNWVRDEQGAGQVGLDSTDSKSVPNSVLAQVPAHASNYMYHDVQIETGAGTGSFSLELDLFATVDLATSGSNIDVNFACVVQIPTDQKPYLSLCIGKTESAGYISTFNSSGTLTMTKVPMSTPIPLNAWHHFRVAFTLSQSGGMTIEMDGAKVGGIAGQRTADPKNPIQYVYPEIGLETDGQWGNTTARFDNVRLTQP